MLSDKAREEIKQLQNKYPHKRSALMPALFVAQREYGWLPPDALREIAELFDLTETEVGSVASFYTMYFDEPVGKHTIFFCADLPCALAGAERALEYLEKKLECKAGETTADGKITLFDAPCLGGCDHAPVALIDNAEHAQDLTNEKLDALVDRLKNS